MTTSQYHKTLRKITLIESMSVCAFLVSLFILYHYPFASVLLMASSIAGGIYTLGLWGQLHEDEL